METTFTFDDLKKVGREYESNFKLLSNAYEMGEVDRHKFYINEERRLNKLDIKIRKSLGVYVPDPCPRVKVSCEDCEKMNGGLCVLIGKIRDSKTQRVGGGV